MKKSLLSLLVVLMSVFTSATTIYVDVDTPNNNGGSDWANAYKYLQDALADANSAGDIDEIRVAQGTYTPDTNSAEPNGTSDRQASFQLINGLALKGGYAGFGAPDPNSRRIYEYETILSGDIGTTGDISDNSYHVLFHPQNINLDNTAVIDGFTITAGNANGSSPHNMGGGMYNYSNDPTIINCIFSGNEVAGEYCYGAGLYNHNSNPIITNCTFSDNWGWGTGYGGGMYNRDSDPTIVNSTFGNNWAKRGGGGMYNYNSEPTVINCTFSDNRSYRGGGMVNGISRPIITNCTFTGNWGYFDGGGMANLQSDPTVTNCTFSDNGSPLDDYEYHRGGGMHNSLSSPTVTNCTFSGNSANEYGGGMYNFYSDPNITNCIFVGNKVVTENGYGGGIYNAENTTVTIINCILWANTASNVPQIYSDANSMALAAYSDVQDGYTGIGNINADPCFVVPGYWKDPGNTPNDPNDDIWIHGDYHLKSAGWRWDSIRSRWDYDDVTSRCIDAGNPGSPLADEPLTTPDDPNNIYGRNLRINMGAYGGTAEASIPPYDWALLSDIDNNGSVNLTDWALFASLWLQSGDELFADFNLDTSVDINDINLLTSDWLNTTIWH